ncbi:hypothetical protein [Methyloglobulus sp.]|uniref:hypothetical protein n=1 Tax=Methyloglobulus sp. TaxID=2518622 RepID=UPI00398A3FFD
MDQRPTLKDIRQALSDKKKWYQEEIKRLRLETHSYAAEDVRRFHEWDSWVPDPDSVVRCVIIDKGDYSDVYVMSRSGMSGSDFEISDSRKAWLIRVDDPNYSELVFCHLGDKTSHGRVIAIEEG